MTNQSPNRTTDQSSTNRTSSRANPLSTLILASELFFLLIGHFLLIGRRSEAELSEVRGLVADLVEGTAESVKGSAGGSGVGGGGEVGGQPVNQQAALLSSLRAAVGSFNRAQHKRPTESSSVSFAPVSKADAVVALRKSVAAGQEELSRLDSKGDNDPPNCITPHTPIPYISHLLLLGRQWLQLRRRRRDARVSWKLGLRQDDAQTPRLRRRSASRLVFCMFCRSESVRVVAVGFRWRRRRS